MTHADFVISWALGVLFLISLALGKIPTSYKGKFWDFLRANYHKHILLGGLFGMILSLTFSGISKEMQLFLTLFNTAILGMLWEWGWGAFNKSKTDYNDVYYAVASALIAVVAHM